MSLPQKYQDEINVLNQKVVRERPEDILQFCANFFTRRLEEERAQYLSASTQSTNFNNYSMSAIRETESETTFPGTFGGFGGFGGFAGFGGFDGPKDWTNSNSVIREEDDHQSNSPTSSFFSTSLSNPETHPPVTPHSPFSPQLSNNPFGTFDNPAPQSRPNPFGTFDNPPPQNRPNTLSPNAAYDRNDLPTNYNLGRRTSVSAESLVPSAANDEWTPPKFPKTDEQLNRLKNAVANNFLFTSLEEDQLSAVLGALNEKPIPPQGTRVITQGDVGDFFYVVEKGSFDVYVNQSGKMEVGPNGMGNKVTSYGPGGSFGELALMYNAPRAATVISTVPNAILWSLDRLTFRRILLENTFKRRRMFEAFLEEVPLLASLTTAERAKIADVLQTHYFEPNATIIKQGEPGDKFYLVIDGIADVFKDGKPGPVTTYDKGDYFGELALLNDEPRAATVIARTRSKVASLGKDGFTRLLGPVAEIMRRNDPRLRESQLGPLDYMRGNVDPHSPRG